MTHLRQAFSSAGIAIVALVLFAGTAAWAQPSDTLLQHGMCATVEVPGVLVLPDGTSHDLVSAKICFERWLSPVSGIHVLYVDDTPWGMLISRVGRDDEANHTDPMVVFSRNAVGQVQLTGYAWPDRHSMLTMVFGKPGRRQPPSLANASDLLNICDESRTHVMIAGRIN
jgi:hypothetical protein